MLGTRSTTVLFTPQPLTVQKLYVCVCVGVGIDIDVDVYTVYTIFNLTISIQSFTFLLVI